MTQLTSGIKFGFQLRCYFSKQKILSCQHLILPSNKKKKKGTQKQNGKNRKSKFCRKYLRKNTFFAACCLFLVV